MLRNACDLTAKLLLDGCKVTKVKIFGMAPTIKLQWQNF